MFALLAAALVGCGAPMDAAEDLESTAQELWVDGELQRLPERRGDLVAYLSSLPVSSRFALAEDRMAAFHAMMDALFDARSTGRWCNAVRRARAAGYTLSRFYDEGSYRNGTAVRRYFVLARDTQGEGQATIVVNPNPSRNVVIEAPHSDTEEETRSEAAFLFRELGARGLVLNGATRCASWSASTCTPPGSGVSVCGKWEPNYRKSDVAHFDGNTFHGAHVAFEDRYHPVTLQLHQFAPVSNWWAVAADGIRTSLGERHSSISVRFRDALRRELPSTVRAGACQCDDDGAHPTLCGDLNLQGRYTNQGVDGVCTTSSRSSTDRFLHLEQHASLASSTNRHRVRDAMVTLLGPCERSGAFDCPSAQRRRAQLDACE